MTSEDDIEENEQTPRRSPDAVLWDDVRFWADAIVSVFGDLADLAQVGLTRSLGVKLCNWLWGVEGAVRRLIIAAALALLSSGPAPGHPPPRQRTERAARQRRPSFRIFGFNSAGEALPASGARNTVPRAAQAFGHIVFPADSLLSIGPRRKRLRAAPVRRPNRLDVVARTFESAYQAPEDYERALLGLPPTLRRPARALRRPSMKRERPASRFDPHSWKCAEAEWGRIIPAPHLAARIFALSRIMERRDQAAQRIARLFARWSNQENGRAPGMSSQPPPSLAWPRHALGVYRCREVEALAVRSHIRLQRLDTS